MREIPSRSHLLLTTSAWLVAGVALWCTRGSLDLFGNEQGVTRVALLPSGPEFLGLIVLVAVLGLGAVRIARRWVAPDREDLVRQMSLPLFALVVLVVPYVPWLPDGWDALRNFAGPLTAIVWCIVLGHVVWAVWAMRPTSRATSNPRTAGSIAIFLASLAIFGSAAIHLTPSYPTGEEPHYLIVMQSLWRDHDLKIENNYARRDYAEYYGSTLRPDSRTRGADGEMYSARPVGLPLLGAPVYGLAGYSGVAWMIALLAALTAMLMWRWTQTYTSAEAATFAWAAIFLSASVLLHSFAVYPEVAAAFCVMVALAWRTGSDRRAPAATEYLVRGLAIAALPWLSTRYTPMAMALSVVLALRAWPRWRALTTLVAPVVFSLAGWLWFFYWIWGVPSPRAPYGSATAIGNLLVGMLGLLIDQEYGVIAFAPVLAIGLVAIVRMVINRTTAVRSRAAEVAVVFASLLVSSGMLDAWSSGSAAPGRNLVAGLPLLGLPLAWTYDATRTHPVRRAACQMLLLFGVAVAGAMVLAQNELLISQDRDGSSEILRWLSPFWPAWRMVPSVSRGSLAEAASLGGCWIAAALLTGWMCRRSRVTTPGAAALTAMACLGAGVLGISLAAPALAAPGSWIDPNPAARARVPLLDSFDATATPLAIVYDPFSLRRAGDVPPLMILTARPGSRTDRQPLRVLLNARFGLPAGEYEVEIGGLSRGDGTGVDARTVGLQVGRNGAPLRRWQATISEHGTWGATFTLPTDAEFVGFVTSASLASARTLKLRPLRIVDASKRIASPAVLSAAEYGPVSVFFHGGGVYPERSGFWLRGRSSAKMTIATEETGRRVTLRIHSGPRPNVVTLESAGWSERIELAPNIHRDVRLPPAVRPGPLLLRVTISDGFVPAEVIPGSRDRRLLGCWMEIVSES